MKIQSILIRHGGTRADLDGIEYHFEPLADGAHVADVAREDHIDRFLGIPEAYKVYHGELSPTGKPTPVGAAVAQTAEPKKAREGSFLMGSDQHASQYEIGGQTYALGDVVRLAFAASGLSEDEWNELDEDDRAAKIDIALDDLADKAEAKTDERAALVEQYVAKFGKKPHHAASIDTIKAKLAEAA